MSHKMITSQDDHLKQGHWAIARSGPVQPRMTGGGGCAGSFLSHRAFSDEGPEVGAEMGQPVAGDELGEVNGVRADVAECSRPCPLSLQPPHDRGGWVQEPVL